MAAGGDADVIKSFLVGLGFDVDEASLSIFNKSIKDAALRVTALYTSITAFAGSIVYAFSKISDSFEEMGYQYHIIAPMINKAIVLRNEMLKAYGSAGLNIRKAILASVQFNMSIAKTKIAMEAIYKSVAVKFFPLLQKQTDTFRKQLYAHMPAIINGLTKFVTVIFKAFDIVVQLGQRIWSILSRIYDFFVELNDKTNGWSTIILGVVAAWKLLNLSFLATPLGMLIAGITALIVLWDDFQVWKEGGKSIFDWSSFVPVINAVGAAITSVKGVLDALFTALFNVVAAVNALFNLDFTKFFYYGGEAIQAMVQWVHALVDEFKSLLGIGSAVSSWAQGIGNWDVTKKLVNWIGGGAQPAAPLGTNNTTNNSNRIIANQQTNITVQGAPNSQATGQAVAGQQGSVNRDMVRNLKGATR
jgi:hypothetical protein